MTGDELHMYQSGVQRFVERVEGARNHSGEGREVVLDRPVPVGPSRDRHAALTDADQKSTAALQAFVRQAINGLGVISSFASTCAVDYATADQDAREKLLASLDIEDRGSVLW